MMPQTINKKIDTILEKYANLVQAVTEFTVNSECQICSKDLRNVLQKYSIINCYHSHPEGGPSTDSSRLTENPGFKK
jgi:hypothetical protein